MKVISGCQARRSDGTECAATVVVRDACLAHQPDGVRMERMLSQAEVGVIDLARADITQPVADDLRAALARSGSTSGVDASRSLVTGDIAWPELTVGRLVRFADAQLRGAFSVVGGRFLDEVDLARATFEQRPVFHSAEFDRDVRVGGASFLRGASFGAASFHKQADFSYTFWGECIEAVEFDTALFAESLSMVDAQFFCDLSFRSVRCLGPVFFSGQQLHRAARFDMTSFGGRTSFSGSTWARDGAPTFHGVQFRDAASFSLIDGGAGVTWRKSTFAGAADFTDADFDTPPPDLTGCTFVGPVVFTRVDQRGWRLEAVTFESDVSFGATTGGERLDISECRWSGPSELSLGDAHVDFDGCTFAARTTMTEGTVDWSPVAGTEFEPRPGTGSVGRFTECTVFDDIAIGDISFETATLAGSNGLEKLRFTVPPRWPTRPSKFRAPRDVVADELQPSAPSPVVLEPLYRQLRAAIEDSKAAPAAADFYYGELDARRRIGRTLFDRFGLWWYRLVGGYGVRPLRPLITLVVAVVAVASVFRWRTVWYVRRGANGVVDGYEMDKWWDTLAFVARSSVTLFSAPTDSLTAGGTLLLLFERLAAVSLVAMTVFAVRSKVAR